MSIRYKLKRRYRYRLAHPRQHWVSWTWKRVTQPNGLPWWEGNLKHGTYMRRMKNVPKCFLDPIELPTMDGIQESWARMTPEEIQMHANSMMAHLVLGRLDSAHESACNPPQPVPA